jgi:hypothetical protein
VAAGGLGEHQGGAELKDSVLRTQDSVGVVGRMWCADSEHEWLVFERGSGRDWVRDYHCVTCGLSWSLRRCR